MKTKNIKRNKGIATLELLIAFALAVVLLVGATMVSFTGQSATLDARLTEHAAFRTQNFQKAAVADVFTDWNTVAGSPVTDDVYTKERTIGINSPCTKIVGSDTAWVSEKNRGHSMGFGTLVANIEAAKLMGGGCDPTTPGNWDTPEVLGSTPPNVIDCPASGLDLARIDNGRYAFLTSGCSSYTKEDLWVIDTTDSTNPVLLSAPLHTNNKLNDIDVAYDSASDKHYAYVVGYFEDTSSSCGAGAPHKKYSRQFQTVDVSAPYAPVLVDNDDLSTIVGCGDFPAGVSVYYHDKKVYVGTKETAGDELTIFDATIADNPVEIASIPVGRNVNDVVVWDGLAYLATGSGAAGVNNPLKIYDVDPLSPTYLEEVGSFTATLTSDQQGTSVYLLGSTLYLGLERASNATRRDFYVLDVSDPSDPKEYAGGSAAFLNLSGSNAFISEVHVQDRYAFLSVEGTASQHTIHIWDISNTSNLHRLNTCTAGNPFPQDASGLKYADNLIFVSFRSNEAFKIIYDTPDLCS